jgi:hypothetical protein
MSNNMEENAKKLALNAVNFDKSNQHELAISYYIVSAYWKKIRKKPKRSSSVPIFNMVSVKEASQSLVNAKRQTNTNIYDLKINQYLTRAEQLKSSLAKTQTESKQNSNKLQHEKDLQKVVCCLNKALGRCVHGLELWSESISCYLSVFWLTI